MGGIYYVIVRKVTLRMTPNRLNVEVSLILSALVHWTGQQCLSKHGNDL